jgi:hypothetical protein
VRPSRPTNHRFTIRLSNRSAYSPCRMSVDEGTAPPLFAPFPTKEYAIRESLAHLRKMGAACTPTTGWRTWRTSNNLVADLVCKGTGDA